MKISALLLCGLTACLGPAAWASSQPRGTLLELHSCELYAGGCIVSGEATLGGRYMLRAWQFTDGSFAGTDLAGLQLAVLESSGDNLAQTGARASQAVVYLPQAATESQRTALLDWLKATEPSLARTHWQTRTTPLQFTKTQTGYTFTAGHFISVSTAPLESCETGSCGEALWYTPRSATSVFTVAVDRGSRVNEPLLELKWWDAGRRTVFLGRFGSQTKNVFVTSAELCGPAGKLF